MKSKEIQLDISKAENTQRYDMTLFFLSNICFYIKDSLGIAVDITLF